MRAEIPLLQNVRVAAPCPADWNEMTEVEGDRVKFCSGCQKRVYNLSAMGQAEAEGLLRRHEGHLCVRYYRRRDGTILTTDCPVGLKAMREVTFLHRKTSFAACFLCCLAFAAYLTGTLLSEQPVPSMGIPDIPRTMQVIEAQKATEAPPQTNDTDSGWTAGSYYFEVQGNTEPIRMATGGVPPPDELKENKTARKSSRKTEKHE